MNRKLIKFLKVMSWKPKRVPIKAIVLKEESSGLPKGSNFYGSRVTVVSGKNFNKNFLHNTQSNVCGKRRVTGN